MINILKFNGNYMSHLLYQSVTSYFFCRFCMILNVNIDYFLEQH
jgi:hypothetical protein